MKYVESKITKMLGMGGSNDKLFVMRNNDTYTYIAVH